MSKTVKLGHVLPFWYRRVYQPAVCTIVKWYVRATWWRWDDEARCDALTRRFTDHLNTAMMYAVRHRYVII
ncbi:MAG TPA: hypothetical protein VGN79_14345 [Devosia sp.]|jgi:hypothetical protein|nr:hypothetical protein [Devosia sp.]